jgi:hypothetical protein
VLGRTIALDGGAARRHRRDAGGVSFSQRDETTIWTPMIASEVSNDEA